MIDRKDIQDAIDWLRPWAMVLLGLGALLLVASGIGKAVVQTGEVASMIGD